MNERNLHKKYFTKEALFDGVRNWIADKIKSNNAPMPQQAPQSKEVEEEYIQNKFDLYFEKSVIDLKDTYEEMTLKYKEVEKNLKYLTKKINPAKEKQITDIMNFSKIISKNFIKIHKRVQEELNIFLKEIKTSNSKNLKKYAQLPDGFDEIKIPDNYKKNTEDDK
jgi:hypothetical protein